MEDKEKENSKDIVTDLTSEEDQEEEMFGIISELPEEKREIVERFMYQSFQMRATITPESEVSKKITSDHITKYIDASEKEMELSYKDKEKTRKFNIIVIIGCFVFFTLLIFMLKSSPNILERIVTSVVSLIAGALGGYGYGTSKR